jgi:glyoxylate/succinic semialdehyde reductase
LQLVHDAGGQYLEAPVSGSKGPAEQGTLIFLTGGDQELFDRSSPLLDVMGKAKFFLGQASSAFPFLTSICHDAPNNLNK